MVMRATVPKKHIRLNPEIVAEQLKALEQTLVDRDKLIAKHEKTIEKQSMELRRLSQELKEEKMKR